MRHGQGKYYYKDGGIYDGNWKEGMIHGFGTLYYRNGKVAYQGEWKQEMFDGHGIIYNDDA